MPIMIREDNFSSKVAKEILGDVVAISNGKQSRVIKPKRKKMKRRKV